LTINVEENFSHSKVQLKTFCPPVKNSHPPAKNIIETCDYVLDYFLIVFILILILINSINVKAASAGCDELVA